MLTRWVLWTLASGPACAIVLWPDAIVALVRGHRLARGAQGAVPAGVG